MHSRLSESLLGVVHSLDGRVSVRFVGVLDKAKSTGPASLAVLDDNLRSGNTKIRIFFSLFTFFFFLQQIMLTVRNGETNGFFNDTKLLELGSEAVVVGVPRQRSVDSKK